MEYLFTAYFSFGFGFYTAVAALKVDEFAKMDGDKIWLAFLVCLALWPIALPLLLGSGSKESE